MVLDLVSSVIGALPEGLAVLIGLGAAAWLFGRARPAAIALGVGLGIIALEILAGIVTWPLLSFASSTGLVPYEMAGLVFAIARVLFNGAHGFGIVVVLAAICIGPAPVQFEVEE